MNNPQLTAIRSPCCGSVLQEVDCSFCSGRGYFKDAYGGTVKSVCLDCDGATYNRYDYYCISCGNLYRGTAEAIANDINQPDND